MIIIAFLILFWVSVMGILFEGIINDLSQRRLYYKDDWYSGLQSGFRFFSSPILYFLFFKNFFVGLYGMLC